MAAMSRGFEMNGMVGAGHGRSMASVNQTRPHCANQMGKTHSKPLVARHGRGTAWARHAMCESALSILSSCHWMLLLACQWCWYLKQTHGADRFLSRREGELLRCQTVRALVPLAPNVISLNYQHSVFKKKTSIIYHQFILLISRIFFTTACRKNVVTDLVVCYKE
jgi:hypothetical protein